MHFDLFINGSWKKTSEQLSVTSPSMDKEVGTVSVGGKMEAQEAVTAAHDALPTWSKMTAYERAELLMKWHDHIQSNEQEIAKVMTSEQGKPLQEALGEVRYANSFIKWYAEEAIRVYGETIPSQHENKRILVRKQPIGVVAAITPWNFPAAMITRKLAPALAAGCTVVVKPAEQTPLTAMLLAKGMEEVGFPQGVVNFIVGDAQTIGEAWLKDDRVRKITFTGSTEVGKLLMRQAADTMKACSFELGGQAPFLICEDADVEQAIAGLMQSKFRNAGQTCICTNRVYVHNSIAERVVQRLQEEIKQLVVGDPFAEGTAVGPLIDTEAVKKVNCHIEDAESKGATIITASSQTGLYVSPTLILGATDDMLCMQEETFGPVIPIAVVESDEEAIERANSLPYGLAAYVYTTSLTNSWRIPEQLQFGIIGVNDGAPSTAQAPFGGMKESGMGREGGKAGLDAFLEIQYISIGV
ncbi:NAD-dependent succinate-semialdehyde dehydrogenase [Bacillus fonticola]|uniref:NAD-dependent succinate-semialdehyde dehydrogenase n=1 Tax=Bacillus fonticola TaxID=2728853 RepID=UPI001D144B20|nr:NAD-dependent succinate-semialdehyde dehydrogenase [Bacillus fonticola]